MKIVINQEVEVISDQLFLKSENYFIVINFSLETEDSYI